jgi:hypothetical protein
MSDPLCPQCSRPLLRMEAPPFMLHAELVIYRCQECTEKVPFWDGDETIETAKHWQVTETGEVQELPPGAPREIC